MKVWHVYLEETQYLSYLTLAETEQEAKSKVIDGLYPETLEYWADHFDPKRLMSMRGAVLQELKADMLMDSDGDDVYQLDKRGAV